MFNILLDGLNCILFIPCIGYWVSLIGVNPPNNIFPRNPTVISWTSHTNIAHDVKL